MSELGIPLRTRTMRRTSNGKRFKSGSHQGILRQGAVMPGEREKRERERERLITSYTVRTEE